MKYTIQDTRYKLEPRRTVTVSLFLVSCLLYLSLNGCGFHLRGSIVEGFPKEFAVMRIKLSDRLAGRHEPLRQAVENALRDEASVTIVEQEKVPTLVLDPESVGSGAVSVNRAGKISEYRISYSVVFRLLDGEGKELLGSQTIRLVRDYTYDPQGVIGKEREDLELREAMRRDAASQIVRRLARSPTVPPAPQPKKVGVTP